jgi:uncharacterized protein YndB with AHSA1/START domain
MNVTIADQTSAALSLPSDLEIAMIRDFKAPRALVFDAWTKAEHVRRWYGMCHFTFTSCELDCRVGGAYRFVFHERERATDHVLSGEFREVERPTRVVFTERYEAYPGSDHVVTLTFEDHGPGTRLEQRMKYPSKQARDAHLASGFETSLAASLSALERFLVA